MEMSHFCSLSQCKLHLITLINVKEAHGSIETDTSPEMILHILLSKTAITSEQSHDKEPNKTLLHSVSVDPWLAIANRSTREPAKAEGSGGRLGFPASSRTQELLYESQCNLRKCLL